MKYDPLTRILHVLVAAGVSAQMMVSLVMVYPKPGRLPNQWYEVHEVAGIALLAVVSAYWLWIAVRALSRGDGAALFPWFSRRLLAELRADIVETTREAVSLRLPEGDSRRPLPSAVQGLGLLVLLAMAGSGTAIAAGMEPNGGLSPMLHAVKEVHEALAPVMWGYLVVHPVLGLVHQLAGHRSLTRMFGAG